MTTERNIMLFTIRCEENATYKTCTVEVKRFAGIFTYAFKPEAVRSLLGVPPVDPARAYYTCMARRDQMPFSIAWEVLSISAWTQAFCSRR